jgi:cytidylate kinase
MAVLTISREFGSGGKDIGHAVAKLLGYDYVDRKRILDDMRKAGKQWEEQAVHFDESYPGIPERYAWAFRGFVALDQSNILEHALKDNVVIMGRGGSFVLKGIPYVLRLRVKAPLEQRIDRVMEWEGVNNETARWLVEKVDNDMKRAVHLIYGKDLADPSEYDMVFDTGVQTTGQIAALLKDALLERDKLKTDKAKAVLQLRALAARVKAAIATEHTFSISVLDVEPKEEGLVQYGLIVRGIVHNQDDIKRIEELARSVAEAVPVECQLHYRWYSRVGREEFK